MKRVIPGCQHDLVRMHEWCAEGACPICLTADAGMKKDEIERLTAENASLKEQLAAREAQITNLYKIAADDILYNHEHPLPNSWYKQTSRVYGDVLREAAEIKEGDLSALREHEARMLEGVKTHITDMCNLDSRIKFYDYLNEQIAARRTK